MFARVPVSLRRKSLTTIARDCNRYWRDVKAWHDELLWTPRADAWRQAMYRERIDAARARAAEDLASQAEIRAQLIEVQVDVIAAEWAKRQRQAHETPLPTMSEAALARVTRDVTQQLNNDLGKPNEIVSAPTQDLSVLDQSELATMIKLRAKTLRAARDG